MLNKKRFLFHAHHVLCTFNVVIADILKLSYNFWCKFINDDRSGIIKFVKNAQVCPGDLSWKEGLHSNYR